MLIKDRQEKRLPERSIDMIILLTDGNPDGGEHAEFVCTEGYTAYLSEGSFDTCSISAYCVCAFEGKASLPVIQRNVRTATGGNMTVFCLGFGNDVDYPFLDVMSRENKGIARRIFEGSDATLQLQVEDLGHFFDSTVRFL